MDSIIYDDYVEEQELGTNGNGRHAAEALPLPTPIPFPLVVPVSGLYEWYESITLPQPWPLPFPVRPPLPGPIPGPDPGPTPALESEAAPLPFPQPPIFPLRKRREELRLDVDRQYPQNMASGTSFLGLMTRVHWIASIVPSGRNTWAGNIWYTEVNAGTFPYTNVTIRVARSPFSHQRSATVTFSGGGTPNMTRVYKYKSPYFHPVEFEFDCVAGTTATTKINTHAHPNRPATLPNETLTIEKVFQRAGFNVKKSGGDDIVPLAGAGANATWSDMEMHDAMQTYWSRFANTAQWSMWVFFAGQHDMGTGLGGIMFDDIGPNHRQGTAMFNNSFISQAPNGDPNPAAWVARMQFWTACHEMGHAFNLAHSWQKSLGTPWIPLADEPEARSFMNYPYNVNGGQTAFFSDFEYRFSNSELLFMRHAPFRFVQMGNADWFDHHGFEQANVSPEPDFRLELRANRDVAVFEFLESPMLELKLTNISGQPQIVQDNILRDLHDMTIILKKQGKEARQYIPYAQYCWQPGQNVVLKDGESIYAPLFIAAGRNGWDLAEPGHYTVQVALHLENDEDLVSNAMKLRVAPPRGYDEEFIAQDFFSDDVGRIMAFGGSRFLQSGIEVLEQVTEQLPERNVAIQARVPLANAVAQPYKYLDIKAASEVPMSAKEAGAAIKTAEPKLNEARKEFTAALTTPPQQAATALGHITYKETADRFSAFLAKNGDTKAAAEVQEVLHDTLAARNVLDRVLKSIDRQRETYEKKKAR